MEAKDVDTAMTFVADDAQCKGSCYFKVPVAFRSYLQGLIDAGTTNQINIVQVDGDVVTYTYQVFRNGFVAEDSAEGESMTVQDGKIIFGTICTSKNPKLVPYWEASAHPWIRFLKIRTDSAPTETLSVCYNGE